VPLAALVVTAAYGRQTVLTPTRLKAVTGLSEARAGGLTT
jgi:hypothetical protein